MPLKSYTLLGVPQSQIAQKVSDWAIWGFVLQSLAMYGPSDSPLYAAVFVSDEPGHSNQLEQLVSPPMLPSEVPPAIALARQGGYQARIVTMTGDAQGVRVVLVSQRRMVDGNYPTPPMATFAFGGWGDIEDSAEASDGANRSLVSVDACVEANQFHVYCALFVALRRRTAWNIEQVLFDDKGFFPGWEQANHRIQGYQRGFARIVAVVPIPMGWASDGTFKRGAVIFSQGDSVEPFVPDPKAFTGGVSLFTAEWPGQMDAFINQLEAAQQRWPLNLSASAGPGAAPSFTCVTAAVGRYGPAPRTFRTNFLGSPNVSTDGAHHGPSAKEILSKVDAIRGVKGIPLPPAHSSSKAAKPATTEASNGSGAASSPHVGTPQLMGNSPSVYLDQVPDLASQKYDPDPQGPASTTQLFSDAMVKAAGVVKHYLLKYSARLGQLAIFRNGRLVGAVACSWAEDGYPAPSHEELLRIGSCSKPLTAMAVLAHVGGSGASESISSALNRTFTTAVNSELVSIRIDELLRHRSGWGSTLADLPPTQQATFGGAEVRALVNAQQKPYGPGAFREFVVFTGLDIFHHTSDAAPFFSGLLYNNINFDVLGEIFSKKKFGDFSHYETSCLDWWAPVIGGSLHLPHLIAPTFEVSDSLGDALHHLRRPGSDKIGNERVGAQYATDLRIEGGGWGWTMNAAQLGRILSRLDPGAQGPQLDPAVVAQTHLEPYVVGGVTIPGAEPRGFGLEGGLSFSNVVKLLGAAPVRMPATLLSHLGMAPGGASYVVHGFNEKSAMSLTVVIAVNQDVAMGAGEMGGLFQALQRVEDFHAWPSEDLAGVLGM